MINNNTLTLQTFYVKNDDGTYSPVSVQVIDDCLTFSAITTDEIDNICKLP